MRYNGQVQETWTHFKSFMRQQRKWGGLRERLEDIPVLAQHFLKKPLPAAMYPMILSEEAQAELLRREWRGNVRELENAIIRGIHLCSGATIKPADLGLPSSSAQRLAPAHHGILLDFRSMKRSVIESFERDYLARHMTEHRGNINLPPAVRRPSSGSVRLLGRTRAPYRRTTPHFVCAMGSCEAGTRDQLPVHVWSSALEHRIPV